MIPAAAQEMGRERGPGDRHGIAPKDEKDPARSHTRAPHHCLALGHHSDTDPSCIHLISRPFRIRGPRVACFFLRPGDGMIRGRIASSVGREIIKKET